MDYRKERNFIVAYDGEKCMGKFDFNTHNFIGMRGKPVKTCPRAFSDNILRAENSIYGHAIVLIKSCPATFADHPEYYARMEKWISVGFCPSTTGVLQYDINPTKEVTSFIRNRNDGFFLIMQDLEAYLFSKRWSDKLSEYTNGQIERFRQVLGRIDNEAYYDYAWSLFKLAIREHVEYAIPDRYFMVDIFVDSIVDTINIQMELYGELRPIKHNLLTTWGNLKYLYAQYRQVHMDELLRKHNDVPALYFETEEYTIYPLLSAPEFHDEATQQNNCVERIYMERVSKGETHVVVVRDKNNPEHSLITCEVGLNGNIVQFLRKNNRWVSAGDPMIEVERAYQEHLNENWVTD